jgi:hypothetical protein
MGMEIQKEVLTKELERVFTIDGKGRPAKAKSLLELIDQFGEPAVMVEIKKISERKVF